MPNVAVWIGLDDIVTEGDYMWTDGSPLAYTNWRNNEPNNFGGNEDCVEFRMGLGWNDHSCDRLFTSVCEKEYIAETCPIDDDYYYYYGDGRNYF